MVKAVCTSKSQFYSIVDYRSTPDPNPAGYLVVFVVPA